MIRDALGLGLAVGLYGVAFGAASTTAGLAVWQSVALSALMFTGASQFALVGVLAAGGGGLAAAGSALLLGTRNTVYGIGLARLLEYRGWRRVLAAHWVIDETTALAVREAEPPMARLAFRTGGAALYAVWNLTTALGAVGAQSFGPILQGALDAVVPAAFLALLWPRLLGRDRLAGDQRLVALVGAGLALALTPVVPAGVQIILAGFAVLAAVLLRPEEGRGGE